MKRHIFLSETSTFLRAENISDSQTVYYTYVTNKKQNKNFCVIDSKHC